MKSLFFITPAYKRFALTEICLRQRFWLCDELAKRGIDATCVIIANDENLEIAESFGFETVEQNNEWLGRKFSDGYEAAAKAGADYVFPIGSDMWALPALFDQLPAEDEWYLQRLYTLTAPMGDRHVELNINAKSGCLYIMPTSSLAHVGFRPCADEIKRGCDYSTWRSRPDRVVEVAYDPFELLGFQSWTEQLSNYNGLARLYGEREAIGPGHFDLFERVYPADLVDQIRQHYEVGGTRVKFRTEDLGTVQVDGFTAGGSFSIYHRKMKGKPRITEQILKPL